MLGLTRAITDTPAEGAVGLAIKNYIALHLRGCSPCDDAAALSVGVWEGADFELRVDARLDRAILLDAIRLVPELAPLARHAIEDDGG
jgi:hypothetical protein